MQRNLEWLQAQWQYPGRRMFLIVTSIVVAIMLLIILTLLIMAVRKVGSFGIWPFLIAALLIGWFLARNKPWATSLLWAASIVAVIILVKMNLNSSDKENAVKAELAKKRVEFVIDSVKKADLGYHELPVGKVTTVVATPQGSGRYLRPFGHVFKAEVLNKDGCSYIVKYEPMTKPGTVETLLRPKDGKHENIEAPRWIEFYSGEDCPTVYIAVKIT